MSDCPRKGKWIGGCRFEGRWDYAPIKIGETSEGRDAERIIEIAKRGRYVTDVCATCGKTIEREKA